MILANLERSPGISLESQSVNEYLLPRYAPVCFSNRSKVRENADPSKSSPIRSAKKSPIFTARWKASREKTAGFCCSILRREEENPKTNVSTSRNSSLVSAWQSLQES